MDYGVTCTRHASMDSLWYVVTMRTTFGGNLLENIWKDSYRPVPVPKYCITGCRVLSQFFFFTDRYFTIFERTHLEKRPPAEPDTVEQNFENGSLYF